MKMEKIAVTRQRRIRHVWIRQLLLMLSVIGPGLITANVDNDATGITGYSLAGANYGYGLLWAVVLVTISLAVVQEMAARIGVVSGKGLADLIREKFGVRITFWSMLLLLIANAATTVAEFAGVSSAMSIFGVSPLISVPIAAILVWVLVVARVVSDLLQLCAQRHSRTPKLGAGLARDIDSINPIQSGLLADPGSRNRDNYCPLDAILSTIRHRGQADQNCSLAL